MISDASRYTTEKTLEWSFKEGVQQTPNLDSQVVGDLLLVNVPRLEDRKVRKKIRTVKQDVSEITAPISRIDIRGPFIEKGKRDQIANKFSSTLCLNLLKYYALHELTYSDSSYHFPSGKFDEKELDLHLYWNPQELEKIDDIFLCTLHTLKPIAIFYLSQSLIDIHKTAQFLKTTKWKTIEYDPKQYEKGELMFLTVKTDLSELTQNLLVRFFNYPSRKVDRSAIGVSCESKELDEKSIEFLRPTRFLKFIGNIWKSK